MVLSQKAALVLATGKIDELYLWPIAVRGCLGMYFQAFSEVTLVLVVGKMG